MNWGMLKWWDSNSMQKRDIIFEECLKTTNSRAILMSDSWEVFSRSVRECANRTNHLYTCLTSKVYLIELDTESLIVSKSWHARNAESASLRPRKRISICFIHYIVTNEIACNDTVNNIGLFDLHLDTNL